MNRTDSTERIDAWLRRRDREGLTWAELSRVSGIAVWTLRYRDSRRSRPTRSAGRRRRRFLPVQVVEERSSPGLEVVTPSGLRLLVPSDFDPDHLRRVLKAVGCSC